VRLVFVRHAESVGNAEHRLQGHADFPLSDLGRTQAERLFIQFKSERFEPTHVYSSPLKRVAETAQIVSREWPVEVSYSDDLKEHNIGVFSGLTWGEAEATYPQMALALGKSRDWGMVEGAESLEDIRRRAERAVSDLIEGRGREDVVVAFAHGGIILRMLAVVLGTDRVWRPPLLNTTLFDFTLDSANWHLRDFTLNNGDNTWRINRFGDASHLDD
jgi:broad specificity phosphatase PhoE